MAAAAGVEPATCSLGESRSIQLSYAIAFILHDSERVMRQFDTPLNSPSQARCGVDDRQNICQANSAPRSPNTDGPSIVSVARFKACHKGHYTITPFRQKSSRRRRKHQQCDGFDNSTAPPTLQEALSHHSNSSSACSRNPRPWSIGPHHAGLSSLATHHFAGFPYFFGAFHFHFLLFVV